MQKDDTRRGLGHVFAAYGLSYVIGILLIATLVYHAGVWNVLANTRLLILNTPTAKLPQSPPATIWALDSILSLCSGWCWRKWRKESRGFNRSFSRCYCSGYRSWSF